jgi:hypothetical protein
MPQSDNSRGMCHLGSIFLVAQALSKQTFCVCVDGFQGLSKSFSLPYTIINFLFASLKLLTNFEHAY